MTERDRDVAGKPLNARPRDGLGRPMPRDAVGGIPRIADDVRLPPDESITEAQRLLDHSMPFHAHEIFEGTWKDAAAGDRDLWQGLAQLAVGLTHLMRGNLVGAQSLLGQGNGRIRHYEIDCPHGLDIAGLLTWSEHLLTEIARGGEITVPPIPRLRIP
ncbi:hypothetical protein ABH922_004073 [Rhodococcus sp. 27YEA15]|uniref:DUF309 domain-containing protein n=1 Tax=Rhodococcus sp. 27YEA15 TaxID=3156259 RepID=UPI003C7DBD76